MAEFDPWKWIQTQLQERLSPPPKDKLLFLHIPKTAGSSFTRVLKSLYREKDIYHQIDARALIALLDSGANHHRLYIGHYSYNVLNHFPVRPRVLTFLRDPRQRIISQYYFYRKQSSAAVEKMPEWDKHIVQLTRQYDFSSFICLDSPQVDKAFSNLQTRQLAESTDLPVPLTKGERETLLSLASVHLQRLDFVGIVERFSHSLTLFRHRFHIHKRLQAVTENVNTERPRDTDDLACFSRNPIAASRVELDLELYRQGLELFDASMAASAIRL